MVHQMLKIIKLIYLSVLVFLIVTPVAMATEPLLVGVSLGLTGKYTELAAMQKMAYRLNHQDPTLINSEIDSFSSSIEQTERAMDELVFITGLSYQDEAPPDLLAEREINKDCKQ